MANSGYNRNYNKNYRSSSYNRPSQHRNYNRRKRRNKRRIRNRIIIVLSMLVIFTLIILLLSFMFRGCFRGNDALEETVATATIAPSTEADSSNTAATPSAKITTDNISDITSTTEFLTPQPEDNNKNAKLDESLLIWNNSAFELFYGSEDSATSYANAINGYANSLGASVTVYNMVVPNHTEIGLPERLKSGNGYSTNPQANNINTIYSKLNSNITPINCYNNLSKHCNEYIYFNTDHHWTALGSYYAYEAFATATGQDVLSLSDCTENKIENFTGSFMNMVSDTNLETDTVSYWTFPYEATMNMATEADGDLDFYSSVYFERETGGSNAYGVFIFGDNPISILKSNRETGKKIAVVKESYGNAFVPYLTYNYDEVHVIDFRYWTGNLPEYCSENGIDEVLFINGIMSANTPLQIRAMDSIF